MRVLVGRYADRPMDPGDGEARSSDIASTLDKLRNFGLLIVHNGRAWSLSTGQ